MLRRASGKFVYFAYTLLTQIQNAQIVFDGALVNGLCSPFVLNINRGIVFDGALVHG